MNGLLIVNLKLLCGKKKKKVESADAYLINHRAVIMAATPLDTVVHLSWG